MKKLPKNKVASKISKQAEKPETDIGGDGKQDRNLADFMKNAAGQFSDVDLEQIERACAFAWLSHDGQKRLSGEPYVYHGLEVAKTLLDLKMDTASVVAGILHDSVDDGAATMNDIEKEFGVEVAELVNGVSKLGKIRLRGSSDEQFVESLRKMFVAMAQDLRVVMIKVADRLHNTRTLQYLPEEKRKRIALETLEIFTPLIDRLGIQQIKGEMEDLAFEFAYPEDYKKLIEISREDYRLADRHMEEIRNTVEKELKEKNIDAKSEVRIKRKYSLYKKLNRPDRHWDMATIYDLIAVRVITNSVEDCYRVLDAVKQKFTGSNLMGMDDYIANPKLNGYRSIHTHILGPDGRTVEVQIRTRQMDLEAENGVAAHWFYTQEKTNNFKEEIDTDGTFANKSKLDWVQQMADWRNVIAKQREEEEGKNLDFLRDKIFVFTPKGDVLEFPAGATPIDFAYAVHTILGDRTVGAKINGKMVSLNTKLQSNDVCEVMLSNQRQKPSREWLDFVVTKLAKREIRKGLKAG